MFPAGSSHVRSRMVTLPSGMCLRVAESGDAAAPPVLLIHGWGASLYMWRDWFAILAANGRRAIAIDLPGHGLSDKPDDDDAYRLPSLVQVVREFIDVEGIAPADIVAQSMGGTITMELVVTSPAHARRVVLVNPACFGRVRLERLFPIARSSVADRILPKLVRRWIVARTHRLQYHDPSTIVERDEDEYWAPSQFPSYTRAMRRLIHVFAWQRRQPADLAQRLRAAGVPMLVLLGAADGLVLDARPYVGALQEGGAGILSRVIENGAHAMNEEWPGEISALAIEFLRATTTTN